VDRIELSTVVYVVPEEVYEHILEFTGFANYSEYLREIRRHGDGSPGTRYDITASWWKLTHTTRSEVTAVDPPNRIDWRLVKDVDARGYWTVEPEPGAAPDGSAASRVRLVVEFAPETADSSVLDLPPLVSIDWVLDRVIAEVEAEAERVVRRLVANLEGQRRDVTLEVHDRPG